jgi:hypothetical protein
MLLDCREERQSVTDFKDWKVGCRLAGATSIDEQGRGQAATRVALISQSGTLDESGHA